MSACQLRYDHSLSLHIKPYMSADAADLPFLYRCKEKLRVSASRSAYQCLLFPRDQGINHAPGIACSAWKPYTGANCPALHVPVVHSRHVSNTLPTLALHSSSLASCPSLKQNFALKAANQGCQT